MSFLVEEIGLRSFLSVHVLPTPGALYLLWVQDRASESQRG